MKILTFDLNNVQILTVIKRSLVYAVYFGLVLFVVVIAVFHDPIFLYFSNLGDKGPSGIAFSAFFGAFFAFLFGQFGSMLGRINERKLKHYNSLVLLDSQLNNYLNVVANNLKSFSDFRKAIADGKIYFLNLDKFIIDETHYLNLLDIVLMNELFNVLDGAKRFNSDSENIKISYEEIKNAYLDKKITSQDYLLNRILTAERTLMVELHLKSYNDKILDLLSRVRLQTKVDKPVLSMILGPLTRSWGGAISSEDIVKERTKLVGETEDSAADSRVDIAKVDKQLKEMGIDPTAQV